MPSTDFRRREPRWRTPNKFELTNFPPLHWLLDHDDISAVFINRWNDVWANQRGRLIKVAAVQFQDDEHVQAVASGIFAAIGIELSARSPLANGHVAGCIRVAAARPPAAPHCQMSLHKPALTVVTTEALEQRQFATPEMLHLLEIACESRANIMITGAPGTGKSTLVRLLGQYLPRDLRVLLVEGAPELSLTSFHPHLISLHRIARATNGQRPLSRSNLITHALLHAPDYLIVDGLEPSSTKRFLAALSAGFRGIGIAAISDLNEAILRFQHRTVHLLAHLERYPDGTIKLKTLAEPHPDSGPTATPRLLYRYVPAATGSSAEGTFVTEESPSQGLRQRLSEWPRLKI